MANFYVGEQGMPTHTRKPVENGKNQKSRTTHRNKNTNHGHPSYSTQVCLLKQVNLLRMWVWGKEKGMGMGMGEEEGINDD